MSIVQQFPFTLILKSSSLFLLLCLFNYTALAQRPFQLYESTWEHDPMGALINSFNINLTQNDNEFSFDTQILLDSVDANTATNIIALDQTCMEYSSYPHYYFSYSLDTVCSTGVEWSQIEISDCNNEVCKLYSNVELPFQGQVINYGFPEYRCNRNSFSLTFQNLNTSTPGFLELILRIGTVNSPNGSPNFDHQYYSEFPILVSINGGSCSNEQYSALRDPQSSFGKEFEIYYPENSNDIEIKINQNIVLSHLKFDLITVTGQTIRSIDIHDYRTTISRLNLTTGIYFLVMTDLNNGHKTSKRIFIQ
ncbi:MAG: T9SS type A sorting domain-containing protein [Flavobacteriales bacterium]|jgi:hypothetical protein|nr:T9SS type A sorting domain-containing protein [Flavobacteriales bacterium]